jgi:hypothetical protein
LREERRLKVFENRALRRTFWSKRDEVQESGENYIMKSLLINTAYVIFLGGKIEKNGVGGACSAYGREERRKQGFGGETSVTECTWKTQ